MRKYIGLTGFILAAMILWGVLSEFSVQHIWQVKPALASQTETSNFRAVSGQQIGYILDSMKGRPSAMFVYASWCPHCRIAMPDVINIAAEFDNQVLVLSTDRSQEMLAQYIQENPDFLRENLALYMWNGEGILQQSLTRFGIKLPRGIPFIALLDEQGYIVDQGHFSPARIKEHLK